MCHKADGREGRARRRRRRVQRGESECVRAFLWCVCVRARACVYVV